jgi:hypothetical protein
MKIKYFAFVLGSMLLLSISAFAATREELARDAASDNPVTAAEAVKTLRTMGRDGLESLLVKYAAEIKQFGETGNATDSWKRIAAAIDTVAMQRDAYASNLYWYTSLEHAKAEAKKTGKPILSLRLLGNLNEEFSCANSRLFRSILYSNAEIAKYLSENYVLHWKSVRPAPKVTIDFGDGRKIERTLTGNSIHYVLDANGQIIDALPGLYSPQAFTKFLTDARGANDLPVQPGVTRKGQYAAFRKKTFDKIASERDLNVRAAKISLVEPAAPAAAIPTAIEAAPRAMAKMVVTSEISILNSISDDFSKYRAQMGLGDWRKLAALHSPDAKIDANGLAFIKRQTKNTVSAEQFVNLVKNIEQFIALDTTMNDYMFRTKIYGILSENNNDNVERINERIYAEIFLTPRSDEWLGLYSPDVYTALDGNGIVR